MGEGLVLRADATAGMGTGHVMRCLALAQAWQSAGGTAVFASRIEAPALARRLADDGFEVRPVERWDGGALDAGQTVGIAWKSDARWVVLDGPHLGAECRRTLREAGQRVLVIDDEGGDETFHADLVLNQNLHADPSLYRRTDPDTELLLGTAYALLRREFLEAPRRTGSEPARVRSLLVTLGGQDPANLTMKVVRAVGRMGIEGLSATVLLGAANPHGDQVDRAARESPVPIHVVRNALDVAARMAAADLAISAGGTTVWELAFVGVPSLVGIVAPVEEKLVRGLRSCGLFRDLGWLAEASEETIARELRNLALDPVARNEMSARGRQTVDGGGSRRVLLKMAAREGERE